MSKRVQEMVARYLCNGKPCKHHMEMAADVLALVETAQAVDREEEQRAALDRVVEKFQKAAKAA